MKCAICGKVFQKHDLTTVRTKWLKTGGFGSVPDEAIVHVKCDKKEQERSKGHESDDHHTKHLILGDLDTSR